MVLHRLTQYIKGNLFVIAAGNEDDLLGEGTETGNGAGRLEAMESL